VKVDGYSCSQRSYYISGHLLRAVLVVCIKGEQSQGSDQALLPLLLALLTFPKMCLGVIQNFFIMFMPKNQAKSLHCIFQTFAQVITGGRVPLCKSLFIFEHSTQQASQKDLDARGSVSSMDL